MLLRNDDVIIANFFLWSIGEFVERIFWFPCWTWRTLNNWNGIMNLDIQGLLRLSKVLRNNYDVIRIEKYFTRDNSANTFVMWMNSLGNLNEDVFYDVISSNNDVIKKLIKG